MLHKRLIIPVLASLPEDQSAFVSRIADLLEKDPRSEQHPNLPMMILKETAAILPRTVSADEAVDLLFGFVEREGPAVRRAAHDPATLADPGRLRTACLPFAVMVAERALVGGGPPADGDERSAIRLNWPIDPAAFPYADPDPADDGD